jgi:hypothetical protein
MIVTSKPLRLPPDRRKCSVEHERGQAVRLNFDTMLYSRDDDFDAEAWRDSLDSAKSVVNRPTLDGVLAMIPETASIPKNDVIQKLRDKGIGKKRARAFIDELTSASGPIYEWRITPSETPTPTPTATPRVTPTPRPRPTPYPRPTP